MCDEYFVKPPDAALLTALREVRLWAREVADNLMLSPGGDQYDYTGSTELVDDLKHALEEYESLFDRHAPPPDTPNE